MADDDSTRDAWSPSGRSPTPAELAALLSGAPFLAGLAPEVVAEVAAACELVHVAGDQRLVDRRTPDDSLYVVVHGGLRTVAPAPGGGRDRVIAESYRGDSVGLLGLLPGVSTPVDVFTIRDSVLLRLTAARFAALGARHPELVLRLAEGVARRGLALLGSQTAWTTWRRPRAAAQNLALLVPGRDPYFARAASELACAALERYRDLGRVTRQSLDAALGDGASSLSPTDAGSERVLGFLQELELEHELVLYECDTRSVPWSERCLRQADRVLVILRADRPDHLEELQPLVEGLLRRNQVPLLDVALVHPEHAETPAAPRLAWPAGSARVLHVRMGRREDYERLARTLVRSGVAVVLSGGGARGIAHVGVLKALEDARVPVDAVAGTSMGAIIAAGYARGWSAEEIMVRLRELFRSRMALYDPTLPFQALLAGRKLERVLQTYFGGLDIENLWLPFFCVSTDLVRAEAHVHDRGELWRAVAASCSIPGIFPPQRVEGGQLVDGGVVDNLPIDVMAARFEGAIIASDVNLYGEGSAESVPRGTTGRLLEFARWLNPLRARAGPGPEIFEILLRSSLVGSQRATLSSLPLASLYLPLPVERFRVLDWGAHDGLYAAGYECATRRLASWERPWARGGQAR